MKFLRWFVIIAGVLGMTAVTVAGCGIPKAEHDALQSEYDAIKAELDGIQAQYDEAVQELDSIKAVYPAGDFPSLAQLTRWLSENDISEGPESKYAEDWYLKALEIQAEALRDGYIVSVDYDTAEDGESISVWCTTIINGRVFFWDPETDEIFEESLLGTVK